MFGNALVSVAASLFLAQSPMALNIVQDWQEAKTHLIQKQYKSYEALSFDVCYSFELALFQICSLKNLRENERIELQGFLKLTRSTIQTAKKRIKKNNLECDKSVLYCALAVEHILESVLDDEFMGITGGYKMPDIMEFGKGLAGGLS